MKSCSRSVVCTEGLCSERFKGGGKKACTDKLMAWNRPRVRKVRPQRVSEVYLMKAEYTKRDTKRLRLSKPLFDPRPTNLRLPNVDEMNKMVTDLQDAHQDALLSDSSKLVSQYGSSCWLKLLEPSPPPSSSSSQSSPRSECSKTEQASELTMTPALYHRTIQIW